MKFKVGDRVCCYGQNMVGSFDVINEEGDPGAVVRVEGSDAVKVKMDNDYGEGRECWFHPKQLRRLVRKERRRVWLHKNIFTHPNKIKSETGQFSTGWTVHEGTQPDANWNEFIEVVRKKK